MAAMKRLLLLVAIFVVLPVAIRPSSAHAVTPTSELGVVSVRVEFTWISAIQSSQGSGMIVSASTAKDMETAFKEIINVETDDESQAMDPSIDLPDGADALFYWSRGDSKPILGRAYASGAVRFGAFAWILVSFGTDRETAMAPIIAITELLLFSLPTDAGATSIEGLIALMPSDDHFPDELSRLEISIQGESS